MHTDIHTCILDLGSFVVDIICILPLDLLCWTLDLGSCAVGCSRLQGLACLVLDLICILPFGCTNVLFL